MQIFDADGDVILAAGVIGSPHLLMLSGIGDPEALGRSGIAVHTALRGVGKNLQDHISAPVAYARQGQGPLHRRLRVDRIAVDLVRQQLLGTGIASDVPTGAMAFLNTRTGGNLPDVQFLFVAAPMTASPYLAPVVKPYVDGFTCRAVLLRPESRGHLAITSADPIVPLQITGNYLSTDRDRAVLRQGLRLARDVGHQPVLTPFIAAELSPGPDDWSDAGLDAHIAATGITVHHPLGTCRMGPVDDGLTVVDSELCVHGIENLRVVDASVMPDMIGGNINAAVIMIAEKASDLIRRRPVLAPAADPI